MIQLFSAIYNESTQAKLRNSRPICPLQTSHIGIYIAPQEGTPVGVALALGSGCWLRENIGL